jgi:hypothetical protein
MRNELQLQAKAKELFEHMFEQRRPTILRDLKGIGAAGTLLREQKFDGIPDLIQLPDIAAWFDALPDPLDSISQKELLGWEYKRQPFLEAVKDMRCWIKHFYDQSPIPELVKVKALRRCASILVKVANVVWLNYAKASEAEKKETQPAVLGHLTGILQLFDWIFVQGRQHFLFNPETGRTNLKLLLDLCNRALSAFRAPKDQTMLPLENVTWDKKENEKKQDKRKYDMFPFTTVGAIIQNILYQVVRANDPFTNRLLSEANFGFIFGEQLILEYEFIRHCIDNKIESMVLIDSYVKKNEIRLNTFEYILRSSEVTLKDQLLTSAFISHMCEEYLCDFREFNIQFSKIDLEFLAFRRSYPIRLECISVVNTTLMLKKQAPRVFSELVTYTRRHFVIKTELYLLRRGRVTNKESTVLLLFAIILESNEENLIHVLMQEGAPEVLRNLIRDQPSIGRKFPILEAYTSPF